MMARHARLSSRFLAVPVCALCVAAIAATSGCKRAEQITSYDLPVSPEPAATHRMLAALVPDAINPDLLTSLREQARAEGRKRGEQPDDSAIPDQVAWFFKVVGPIDAVAKVVEQYDAFLRSLTLRGGARPTWTLPEGWREDPGVRVEGRDATIRLGDGSDALELTVSRLVLPKQFEARLVLSNINRWRGQMNLRRISYSEFDAETRTVEIGDNKAIVADLKGVYSGVPMSQLAKSAASDPHANLPAATRAAAASASAPSTDKDRPIAFEKPESWKEGRSGGFRVAAFTIDSDNGQRAEVTVIPLGAEAGDLKGNADRWAGEIKLPPFKSIDEVREQLRTIRVDGIESDMLYLKPAPESGSPEATIGVITRRGDSVWFFKLRGSATVVEQEREHFEEFVKSVKFK